MDDDLIQQFNKIIRKLNKIDLRLEKIERQQIKHKTLITVWSALTGTLVSSLVLAIFIKFYQ